MLKINRICVPLTLDCNLHCRYCYRDRERLDEIPDFTLRMIRYLSGVSPSWCEAVVASGGEPLLRWDRVKELFSYVPKEVHKKIMSNGTLLTQEMVDYINDNDIELLVSHDGKETEFFRGVDIMRDGRICGLLRQVRSLTVSCVVTRFNNDVWENFFDTVKCLHRTDFVYICNPMNNVIPEQDWLVDGFDYDKWCSTSLQFSMSPFCYKSEWYRGRTLTDTEPHNDRFVGYNVLPDGTVTGMIRIRSVYGTVDDTREECDRRAFASGLKDRCSETACPYVDRCRATLQSVSEHTCRCNKVQMDAETPEHRLEVFDYVNGHLEDIVKKYFDDYEGYLANGEK